MFKAPYPRPKQLSDPWNERTSPQNLANVLEKKDQDLRLDDYGEIFGIPVILPGGTYEETCYFLPLAFEYVVTNDEQGRRDWKVLDLIWALVGYCSWQHVKELAADNLLGDVRKEIEFWLAEWTKCFTVGSHGANSDLPDISNFEFVWETLNELMRRRTHADIASSFVIKLAESDKPEDQAWFLAIVWGYLFHAIDSDDFALIPPELTGLLQNKQQIHSTLNKLLQVSDSALQEFWLEASPIVEAYCASEFLLPRIPPEASLHEPWTRWCGWRWRLWRPRLWLRRKNDT